MGKMLIRLTVVGVSLYIIACYVCEVVFHVNIWQGWYRVLFELCVCLCISKQGVYHCRFVKYTAYGITVSDAIVCIDNLFDIFPAAFMVFIPPVIISSCLTTTTILAIDHYIKVKKLKRKYNGRLDRQTVPTRTEETSR